MIARPAPRTALAAALAAFVVLVLPGCDDIDTDFVPVGSMRVLPVDPGQTPPTLTSSDVVFAQWQVASATARYKGLEFDLTAADACNVTDTLPIFPTAEGRCRAGIAVGSIQEPQPIAIEAALTMTVRRMVPLDLPVGGDYDGDGVINVRDNCPLASNPDQFDSNDDGIGEVCEFVVDLTTALRDDDLDEVPNSIDNCIYLPNPDQIDSDSPPDGIGDACPTQSATVFANGSPSFDVEGETGAYALPANLITYVVLDFAHGDVLDCDWEAGLCDLDLEAVGICARADLAVASIGCPD